MALEALIFCTNGVAMTLVQTSSGAVASTRHAERFFQLSSDLSTMRWSWTAYLLIDELVSIVYDRSKPLCFSLTYAPVSGSSAMTLRSACSVSPATRSASASS